MNRFVLFGLLVVALSCYANAEEFKRYVYDLKRDARQVFDLDEDFDEDKNEMKRFVYKRDIRDFNKDQDNEYKRFVVSAREARAAAGLDMSEDDKRDMKRFVYPAREARQLIDI